MPDRPEVGRMAQADDSAAMNRELFESHPQPVRQPQVSGEQLLSDIASQVRLAQGPAVARLPGGDPARRLPGLPRPERAGLGPRRRLPRRGLPREGPRPVAVGASRRSTTSTRTSCPTRPRDTPGFKVPRQIKVEILSIDGNALARGIKDKLTEAELLSYYENRKAEFKQPSDFPDEIFARAARADAAARYQTVRRGPALPRHLARRGEGAGRDRQPSSTRSRTR